MNQRTQITNLDTLLDFPPLALWYREEHGFKIVLPDTFETFTLSSSLVNAYHPSASITLRAALQHATMAKRREFIFHGDAISNLKYANGETIHLRNVDGANFILEEIASVKQRDNFPTQCELIAVGLTLDSTEIDGSVVSFTRDKEVVDVVVDNATLANIFPGWEQRLTLAQELGLRYRELWQTVFTKKINTAEIDQLSNITF